MKDTFTLWGSQSPDGRLISTEFKRQAARRAASLDSAFYGKCRVVKLECRIVPRKPKRGTYPNDNFGLPAGYTPHNPDNLTREQVGEGFRLLADVEIWERYTHLPHIHYWKYHIGPWDDTSWQGSELAMTYRVPINTPLDINPELKTK